MRILKEKVQTTLILIVCSCAMLAVGAIEADNFSLAIILTTILLINTYILIKYGRGDR